MNQMETFKNPEFGSIRVVEENGKYLFCGADAARALGYARPNEAVSKHCKGTLKRRTPTTGGIQEMLFIPEGDLYRLIVHSKLPSAERFEQWVFDEVLPTIRKHGAYLTKEKMWEVATSPEALMKLCSDYVKNTGLFCVKDYCNHGHTGSYTLVTPKGKIYFAQLREMILLIS